MQTSDATGAAASQLSPHAQAAIILINKDAGLSHGKVVNVFDTLLGIGLTRGAVHFPREVLGLFTEA